MRSAVRELARRLEEVDDPRARAALAAVAPRKRWDLAALEAALTAPDPEAAALQALASLQGPDREPMRIAVDALLAALSESDDTRHASALDERGAELVRTALAWHETHGDQPCPVCGTGQLGAGWRGWAELWLAERRSSSERAGAARSHLAAAVADARAFARTFEVPTAPGIDTSALTAAIAHLGAAAGLTGRALATAVEERVEAVAEEVAAVAALARARLAEREERWRPVAAGLASVLEELGAVPSVDPPVAPSDAPRAVSTERRTPRRSVLERGA